MELFIRRPGGRIPQPKAEKREFQDLSTFAVAHGWRGRSAAIVAMWQLVQATVFAWSPQFAYAWRRWLLRLFGAEVGKGVLIRQTARVTYPWKARFGEHCWIGDHAEIYSLDRISVGAHSVISQRCYLCAGTHSHDCISFPLLGKPITIGEEVWIATDSFIAPGVQVGDGAIVASRSTVLSDVPPRAIVAGCPARFKRQRDPSPR